MTIVGTDNCPNCNPRKAKLIKTDYTFVVDIESHSRNQMELNVLICPVCGWAFSRVEYEKLLEYTTKCEWFEVYTQEQFEAIE